MPTFRCEFDVTGDLVLPVDIDQLSFSSADGFVFTIKNAPLDKEGHAPGLIAFVVGIADSMDNAEQKLREALAAHLDLLSFVTHSRFKIVGPRRLVEWDDWQKTRQVDWFHKSDPRYPPDPELAREYLNTVAALDQATPPAFTRKALHYFRYGLIDPDPEDQFMRFWLALEIVAENFKEKERVPIACPNCNAAIKCGACGVEPMRIPMAKQAIENLFATTTTTAEVSRRLFDARNTLVHGGSRASVEGKCKVPLDQVVNELATVVWHVIMSSIRIEDGGPTLRCGQRGGAFANNAMLLTVRGVFKHNGNEAHPTEESIPRSEIKTITNFRQPMKNR